MKRGTPKNETTIPTGILTGDRIVFPIASEHIKRIDPVIADAGNRNL